MKNQINLLNPSTTVRTANGSERVSKPLVIFCILLVVASLAAYGTIYLLERRAQDQLASVRQDINALVNLKKQNAAQGNIIAEWNNISTQIDKLNTEKPKFSNYLDELKAVTPAGVTLTGLSITDQPFAATIKGVSASPTQIAQFGRNLQESIYFKNGMITAGQKQVKGNFFEFTVTVTPDKEGGVNR